MLENDKIQFWPNCIVDVYQYAYLKRKEHQKNHAWIDSSKRTIAKLLCQELFFFNYIYQWHSSVEKVGKIHIQRLRPRAVILANGSCISFLAHSWCNEICTHRAQVTHMCIWALIVGNSIVMTLRTDSLSTQAALTNLFTHTYQNVHRQRPSLFILLEIQIKSLTVIYSTDAHFTHTVHVTHTNIWQEWSRPFILSKRSFCH